MLLNFMAQIMQVFFGPKKKKIRKFFASVQRRKADDGVRIAHLDLETRMNSKEGFCKEQIFSWSQSVEWACKEQSLWSGPVVTIQEQHPLGRDCHGRPLHHAVFVYQVGGGVLAPWGPTSSSSLKSTRVPWIGKGRRRRGKVGQRKRGHP